MASRAEIVASNVLEECGITDPLQLPVDVILNSKDLLIKEEEIDGAEGRIVMNETSGVITINSKIQIPTKKRFVLAHELGHFELHRNKTKIYNDDDDTLNRWYDAKFAVEETEANEFAAEFLMPSEIFHSECKGKKFGPEVIDYLASRFQVSKTAAILKFANRGNHPICIVYCKANRMKWWKKSDDFRYFLNFQRDHKPPGDSVAYEVFTTPNRYYDDEQKQNIWKSTWFELKHDERDKPFYEFCLFASSYNYTLSVIWED
ncbi:MAG: ImmA/IrrE family metallo-endopeptidase [Bacteroidota bacterium]|jgi:Zn-dependent peptidase ImmA (M78 family)